MAFPRTSLSLSEQRAAARNILAWSTKKRGRPCSRPCRDICPAKLTPASWRYITRVTPASIVEPAVPSASPPPTAPGNVIAVLTVWISGFPGRTIEALGVVGWAGDRLPGHSGPGCQHKSRSSAEDFEFHRTFLHSLRLLELPNGSSIEVSFFRGAVQIIAIRLRIPQVAFQIHSLV